MLTNCNSIIRYIFILIFIFDFYEILRDNETHRIFESRIPIAPFRRPRHSFASDAVVRGNTVKAVSVQRHWSTSFAVVKSRLPFPHNELQIIFQFLHRRPSLSLSLFFLNNRYLIALQINHSWKKKKKEKAYVNIFYFC